MEQTLTPHFSLAELTKVGPHQGIDNTPSGMFSMGCAGEWHDGTVSRLFINCPLAARHPRINAPEHRQGCTVMNTLMILDAYRRVRPIQRQLGTLASKKIGKPAIESEAKMIGLWRQGGLVLESDEEINTLLDHLVHDGHGSPTTPLNRITAKDLGPFGVEGQQVHAAFSKARLNIWRLVECRPGLGWVVEDMWHQQAHLVVDAILSEQPQLKDAAVVMRLVNMGEWCFNTGVQGPTLGEASLDTLQALILASPLVDIAPADFHPESFTWAQNLMWSRILLRSWLRPGSVKLVTVPLEVGSRKVEGPRKGR